MGQISYFPKLSVHEPNSENCLDLVFAAPPYEEGIFVPDTNYITSGHHGSLTIFVQHSVYTIGLCKLIFNYASSTFT